MENEVIQTLSSITPAEMAIGAATTKVIGAAIDVIIALGGIAILSGDNRVARFLFRYSDEINDSVEAYKNGELKSQQERAAVLTAIGRINSNRILGCFIVFGLVLAL